MTTPRFTKSIALSLEDNTRLENLQKKGIKIIDVFKAGLDTLEKQKKS